MIPSAYDHADSLELAYTPNHTRYDTAIHHPHPTLPGLFLDLEGRVFTSVYRRKHIGHPRDYFIRLRSYGIGGTNRVFLQVPGEGRKSRGIARLMLETFVGPVDGRKARHESHPDAPDEPADALRNIYWSEARVGDDISRIMTYPLFTRTLRKPGTWGYEGDATPYRDTGGNTPRKVYHPGPIYTLKSLYEEIYHPTLTRS